MKVRGVLVVASIAVAACVFDSAAWGAVGAHEHGVADLTVAVEGQSVDLMLTAPSADLVGFERAPTSEQERLSIQERLVALEAGDWFIWDGARCELVSVAVTLPAVLTPSVAAADHRGHEHGQRDHARHHEDHDHKHHDHKHHDHKHHDHKHRDHKHHDHKHHDHKHHDHEQHDLKHHDHEQEHMDGLVNWQYRCEPGARLRRVDVQLFELLPLQRIRAQVISERGQGAGNLTPRARQLSLP